MRCIAMPTSHAEQEERARAYEAARQHYIKRCARQERAERRKLERREHFRQDMKVAVVFIFFIFGAVWFFLNSQSVTAWWKDNLQKLWQNLFGA
jgi:hypothetical protein